MSRELSVLKSGTYFSSKQIYNFGECVLLSRQSTSQQPQDIIFPATTGNWLPPLCVSKKETQIDDSICFGWKKYSYVIPFPSVRKVEGDLYTIIIRNVVMVVVTAADIWVFAKYWALC